jgi:hypothetical protein
MALSFPEVYSAFSYISISLTVDPFSTMKNSEFPLLRGQNNTDKALYSSMPS